MLEVLAEPRRVAQILPTPPPRPRGIFPSVALAPPDTSDACLLPVTPAPHPLQGCCLHSQLPLGDLGRPWHLVGPQRISVEGRMDVLNAQAVPRLHRQGGGAGIDLGTGLLIPRKALFNRILPFQQT